LTDITVAICTRNRCGLLDRALTSLSRVVVPSGVRWELIVVDNGSRDATAATIARFAGVLPIRALDEPRVGKSHAMNTAVREARGDSLLWLDDDVLVDAQWMCAYRDALLRHPETTFFGGPIIPLFEGPRPPWLDGALPHVANAYAALDFGSAAIPLEGDTLPYGANWAVRAHAQRRHPYDPDLGRKGEQLSAGEEWAVMAALLGEGAAGLWVPSARVHHVIPPERQTVQYLRRYYVGNGGSLARVRSSQGEPMLMGRPRWLWREAVVHELLYRLRRVYAPPDAWSDHLRRASVAWGMLLARTGRR
jgi:hypothetical protein